MQLVCRLGIAPSRLHRILVDAHLNRLSPVDRATSEPICRYEHDNPGAMIHVDVKKLGNIPGGGGWRLVGCQQGEKNRTATPDRPGNKYWELLMGKACVHTVLDDQSASPTQRSTTAKPRSQPRRSLCGTSNGSMPAASPLSGS